MDFLNECSENNIVNLVPIFFGYGISMDLKSLGRASVMLTLFVGDLVLYSSCFNSQCDGFTRDVICLE